MEGKGQKDGKRPFPLRNTTDSSLTACVVRPHPRFLTVPLCLSLFPWHGASGEMPNFLAGREAGRGRGAGLECQDDPPGKTLRNQLCFLAAFLSCSLSWAPQCCSGPSLLGVGCHWEFLRGAVVGIPWYFEVLG